MTCSASCGVTLWRARCPTLPSSQSKTGFAEIRDALLSSSSATRFSIHILHVYRETLLKKSGYNVKVDLRFLFSRQPSLLGSFMGAMGELHRVLQFVFRGQLKPVIDRVYRLPEIRAAHERLEGKEQFGKVLVVP